MALTYHERHTRSADPVFIGRTRQAILKYALYISGNPATPDNEVRLLQAVLNAPERYAQLFADAVSMNDFFGDGTSADSYIDSTAGDAALSSVVEGSVWVAFAREV